MPDSAELVQEGPNMVFLGVFNKSKLRDGPGILIDKQKEIILFG